MVFEWTQRPSNPLNCSGNVFVGPSHLGNGRLSTRVCWVMTAILTATLGESERLPVPHNTSVPECVIASLPASGARAWIHVGVVCYDDVRPSVPTAEEQACGKNYVGLCKNYVRDEWCQCTSLVWCWFQCPGVHVYPVLGDCTLPLAGAASSHLSPPRRGNYF
jgi:hypothetical protein